MFSLLCFKAVVLVAVINSSIQGGHLDVFLIQSQREWELETSAVLVLKVYLVLSQFDLCSYFQFSIKRVNVSSIHH